MLLRTSSTTALNSVIGIQSESELILRRSGQLAQLVVADGKSVHHDVQPRIVRTLSEVDLHSPLSNACSSKMRLARGSGSDLSEKLSTEIILSNGLLDESLEEDFDRQISIGFQSAGEPQEESPEKIMAANGTHGGAGPFISGRRMENLMRDRIYEGTGVALVCDRAVLGSKTEMGSVNDGFGGEDEGGLSGGRGGNAGRRGGSGSYSNQSCDALKAGH
jgi:hypothetical protein